MAKFAGNDLVLKVQTNPGTTGTATYGTIGGSSSHTYTLTNANVDTTDKDSDRWGETQPFGRRQITFSFNGFVSDNANFEIMRAASQTDSNLNYQLAYGNSELVTGEFHIDSFEVTGEAEGAQTFTVSMTSSEIATFLGYLYDSTYSIITDSTGASLQGVM